MKRFKIALMTTAIAAAMCSAFVTKPADICDDCPQYYYANGYYYPAGNMGESYDCDNGGSGANTCTYYKPDPAGAPYTYALCHYGEFYFISLKADQSKK